MNGNIYLTGFMGVGKTTVGRLLAEALGRSFMDMDEMLATRLGQSIADHFAARGEASFREAETELLQELSRRRRLVVATGGGVVERDANRAAMRESGRVVFLDAALDACRTRMDDSGAAVRPLWQDMDGLRSRFDRRRPLYLDCDLRIQADNGDDPATLAADIVRRFWPDQVIHLSLGDKEHAITTTTDAARGVGDRIDGRRAFLIMDANLARLHGDRYRRAVPARAEIILPAGERAKTISVATRAWKTLFDAGCDRGDLVVVVGGGATTDLGAFVSASYKRGLPFILCATTLLACVDAAVGGKTGVNFAGVKNGVGFFAAPEAVMLDTAALATLSPTHLRDGLVEAYKTGLVADPVLAALIEEQVDPLLAGDRPLLGEIIQRSARAKASVVAGDFREQGGRVILNFGHTVGHALESNSRRRISHGRAVGLGMLAVLSLSRNRELIGDEEHARAVRTVNRILGRRSPLPPADALWTWIANDKKARGGRVPFVLLAGTGATTLAEDVTPAELDAALTAGGL